MAASTATYMGLRTWRYGPPTTKRSGAATGAGVPRPSTTKRQNAWISATSPAASSAAPSTRTDARYGTDSRTLQPVSIHGTRPATTPGAARKNAALPTAAVRLRILRPPFGSCTLSDGPHEQVHQLLDPLRRRRTGWAVAEEEAVTQHVREQGSDEHPGGGVGVHGSDRPLLPRAAQEASDPAKDPLRDRGAEELAKVRQPRRLRDHHPHQRHV